MVAEHSFIHPFIHLITNMYAYYVPDRYAYKSLHCTGLRADQQFEPGPRGVKKSVINSGWLSKGKLNRGEHT